MSAACRRHVRKFLLFTLVQVRCVLKLHGEAETSSPHLFISLSVSLFGSVLRSCSRSTWRDMCSTSLRVFYLFVCMHVYIFICKVSTCKHMRMSSAVFNNKWIHTLIVSEEAKKCSPGRRTTNEIEQHVCVCVCGRRSNRIGPTEVPNHSDESIPCCFRPSRSH